MVEYIRRRRNEHSSRIKRTSDFTERIGIYWASSKARYFPRGASLSRSFVRVQLTDPFYVTSRYTSSLVPIVRNCEKSFSRVSSRSSNATIVGECRFFVHRERTRGSSFEKRCSFEASRRYPERFAISDRIIENS